MVKESFLKLANEIENEIINDRRWLHAHAETGFELDETVKYVKERLTEIGCKYTDCGTSGVIAFVGNDEPAFLLRADMDALPGEEKSGENFASENGNMHACGHDMHTAMLLGVASILKKHEKDLKGTVKLMFQPAEETLCGAKKMVENGVLNSPEVTGALMLHVLSGIPVKTGTIIIPSEGVGAPAADYFTINVQGKGCHGSTPQLGIDALTSSSHILIALQEISARELGVSDSAVLTVGSLHGGTTGNVIADTAVLQGTMRAFDDKIRDIMKKRLCEIAESVGSAFRTKVTVSFGGGCPTFLNDGALAESTAKALGELLGNEWVINADDFPKESRQKGGSEDFAYVSQKVPSLMLSLAAGEPDKGHKYTQHHPKVTFDESVLKTGAVAMAYIAYKLQEEQKH